ncbi:hypothetical protein F2Q70_00029943 [Brassica cretica]|uniref:Uncharacterized protein n=2 Tax=Brassica cretica TaxID=69181 RepID=A0A8S9MUZ4_BRACR|nr:hypothetical protein F2Q70_00029943 [Brassica cretica]KAF2550830.1 hypothetical protein F2Q68_00034416 [Brassica cretica]KAF3487825.1 hypothetical protein F2Q69_00053208 [Brassica cretica]KAF3590282.1 hypothetical protein DY000_02022225 [Brassica cretica]
MNPSNRDFESKSIQERVGARVWNRPGDRQSVDDPTRSQSRLISPTPLAQTRGELTELQGMVSTLIDEIRNQKIINQTIANRLEQAEREFAEHRPANARTRNQTPLDPRKLTTTPAAGHDPLKLKLQWIGQRHWAPTPTKHSDPIPERINRKTRGIENTNPGAEPFDRRILNFIRHEDLPSNGIR